LIFANFDAAAVVAVAVAVVVKAKGIAIIAIRDDVVKHRNSLCLLFLFVVCFC
jgi:hypothetical protein